LTGIFLWKMSTTPTLYPHAVFNPSGACFGPENGVDVWNADLAVALS
jgi:hypothetical protein